MIKNNDAILDGMPPKKKRYDNNEKMMIVAKAEKFGARAVAEAYGLKWQHIASWKAHKETEIIIQSPMGGSITTKEILDRVGDADKIYVRVDENKAYYVKGQEAGSVDLWNA